MIPSNTSSKVPKPSSYAKFLSPRMNNLCNPSCDRHSKVKGKDRRIRIPIECAEFLFELKKMLDHRSAGQTLKWIFIHAKASIDAAFFSKNQTFDPSIFPYLSRPMLFVPPDTMLFPSHDNTMSQLSSPILDDENKMASSISRSKPILPCSKYGSGADEVEISADVVAKFLYDSSW
ncbi:hypothetical protein ACH5RR_009840 [Cinchona calisaya]|uniref:TCP domain-containing protein n=1 Tax=Cinchona calisaya TaxID=153742 RepID=A0ABD3AG46_9GENT